MTVIAAGPSGVPFILLCRHENLNAGTADFLWMRAIILRFSALRIVKSGRFACRAGGSTHRHHADLIWPQQLGCEIELRILDEDAEQGPQEAWPATLRAAGQAACPVAVKACRLQVAREILEQPVMLARDLLGVLYDTVQSALQPCPGLQRRREKHLGMRVGADRQMTMIAEAEGKLARHQQACRSYQVGLRIGPRRRRWRPRASAARPRDLPGEPCLSRSPIRRVPMGHGLAPVCANPQRLDGAKIQDRDDDRLPGLVERSSAPHRRRQRQMVRRKCVSQILLLNIVPGTACLRPCRAHRCGAVRRT